MTELISTTASQIGFPGRIEDILFVPNDFSLEEAVSDEVWEKVKDTIDYARHMYAESKRLFVFGVTGFYCMKYSIEKAFELHGFQVQLDDAFTNLFIGQPPETPKDFAVYVLVSYWFYSFIQIINTRLKRVVSEHEKGRSRFGTMSDVGFPTDIVVPSDAVARFLSGRRGDVALLREPDVQAMAKQRVESFVQAILGLIQQIPDKDQAPILAAEMFILISSGMTELVLLDFNKRIRDMSRTLR